MKEVDVVIAGGGPVGMTLAYDLSSRGVRCLVAERNKSTTSHPKMDITNGRTMEMFRQAGLADALRQVAVPEQQPFDVSWITCFTGEELHRFRYPSPAQARSAYRSRNNGSDPVEPPMRVSQVEIEPVLRRAIEANPLVEVRFGLEFEKYDEHPDGVTVYLRVPGGDVETVRCRYLIGCDGGGSRVRSQLGIGLEGQMRIMQRYMTHFKSSERELLMRWGPAWHYQSAHGTLISQNDENVWTLHTRVPEGVPVDQVDPRQLVAQFVGRPIDMEILVANPWTPHLVVADSYRRGRIFLAGDAAHQYIPTGGYGMNTGVADAFDLGWKLAAVLKGWGGAGLVDSYQAERQPVGRRNRDAAQRHNDVRVAIGKLYSAEINDGNADGKSLREIAAQRIAELGNAENESWGIEMGYRYLNSPILPPGPEEDEGFDPLLYVPRIEPGTRLPNMYLEDGSPLYGLLGHWFTWLSFDASDMTHVEQAALSLGIPVKLVKIHERDIADFYGGQAILVRPDQFIAWRGTGRLFASDAEAILKRAVGLGTTQEP